MLFNQSRKSRAYIFFNILILLLGLLSIQAVIAKRTDPNSVTQATPSPSSKAPPVSARLIADTTALQAGKSFRLGIELTMAPGWHTYYKDPGQAGMPTKIDWQLPPGFTVKSPLWEKPHQFDEGGIVTFGYIDKTLIAAEVLAPKSLPTSSSLTIKAKVTWLSCNNICVPGGTEVTIVLPVVTSEQTISQTNTKEFAKASFDGSVSAVSNQSNNSNSTSISDNDLNLPDQPTSQISLLTYIGFAFIGGIILNFMPCVLPVIAIKILSLFEQADKDPLRIRQLGFSFSAGIISSFLVLAGLIITLQAAGHNLGWGFQFQYPPFLIVMSFIVLIFALSLFGQLNFSINLGQKEVTQLSEQEGLSGTFFKGVLATILSTPCTAPFLGTALGFAFIESWWVIFTIFFAVGLGMSFPYLLLTGNPNWMKFLPKPGDWMEKLKEFFGFVLLSTVIWLVSILGNQVGLEAMMRTTYFLLAVALSIWIVNKFSDLSISLNRVIVVRVIALGCASLAFYLCIFPKLDLFFPSNITPSTSISSASQTHSDSLWKPFTISDLEIGRRLHKTVFVDFTAQWCLTCQVNENTVLRTKPIEEKLKALNVVLLKADWTRQDPIITNLLRKFGRSGVPLYVIFPGKAPDQPIILPEIITTSLVLQKLDEAGPSLPSSN